MSKFSMDGTETSLLLCVMICLMYIAAGVGYGLGKRSGEIARDKIWCEALAKNNINIASCGRNK